MNKFVAYLVIGVVAILCIMTMAVALASVIQLIVYAAVAVAALYILSTGVAAINKYRNKQKPPS